MTEIKSVLDLISTYEVLSRNAQRPVKALQRLRAELLGMEHARLLAVPPSSAALYPESQVRFFRAAKTAHFRRRTFSRTTSLVPLHLPNRGRRVACGSIERRGFLADGSLIEFARSHYRGDAYDFVAELHI